LLLLVWVLLSDWPNPTPDVLPAKVDVIIVLGGGAKERPRQAWKLFQEGHADRVIVTGDGHIITSDLLNRGLPQSALIHETAAVSTLDNAKKTLPILNELHVKTAILVTTWNHAPRALAIFKRACPNIQFYSSFEPEPESMTNYEIKCKRKERVAALYCLFFKGIWCF
jgi:uncharacterized SAM-binding protein YcdF (DUF218 family)